MNELVLPESIWKIINKYKALNLGGKDVRCPYFINVRKAKDLRAMVGKGTPEEIELEAKMWEKLKGADFNEMTEKEIRQFLIDRGIGIDCSGFIMHVLNEWHLEVIGKPIWGKFKIPNKSIIGKISYVLKPVQKLGAEIMTNSENAKKVSINKVKPLDVIRSKGKKKNSHHIMLVTKVVKDDNGNTREIHYINSSEQYGDDNGTREGKIVIKDSTEPLQNQEWIDPDKDGTNHTYEGFLVQVKDNGIRRLNALKDLQKKI